MILFVITFQVTNTVMSDKTEKVLHCGKKAVRGDQEIFLTFTD